MIFCVRNYFSLPSWTGSYFGGYLNAKFQPGSYMRVFLYWIHTEPQKSDAQPFKVPCEQSENNKRSRENEVSGKIFNRSKTFVDENKDSKHSEVMVTLLNHQSWLTPPSISAWLTSFKAMKIYPEYSLKQCLWKIWSSSGFITSLRDKRSSWGKSWISVCGHISSGIQKRETYGSSRTKVSSRLLYRG